MKTARLLILAGLLALLTGCHSPDSDETFRKWQLDAVKEQARSYDNVVLVCVYESNFIKMPPGCYHRWEGKGTVVRSYKGNWTISETINLERRLEGFPDHPSHDLGYLEFIFTNVHTNAPVGIDVGEDWEYQPEFDRALESMFNKK